MAHDRPDRSAPGIDKALEVLTEGRSVQYDVDVVDALLHVIRTGFSFADPTILEAPPHR